MDYCKECGKDYCKKAWYKACDCDCGAETLQGELAEAIDEKKN